MAKKKTMVIKLRTARSGAAGKKSPAVMKAEENTLYGIDPALEMFIGREGGEVIVRFEHALSEVRLSKANAVLLADHLKLHSKHLSQQKEK